MQAGTQRQPRRNDPMAVIRRWPIPSPGRRGLRPEAKLIWSYLYEGAGGVERSIVIHAAHVGAANAMSERACRRALDSLADWTLIEIPDRYNGEITVYLNDPQKVAEARLKPGESSGQGELEFPDTPTSPSEVVPIAEAEAASLPLRPVGPAPPPPLASNPPADMASNPPPSIEHNSRARIEALSIKSIEPSNALAQARAGKVGGFDAKSAAKSAGEESRDWQRIAREVAAAQAKSAQESSTLGTLLGNVEKTIADRVARIDIPGQEAKAKETAAWIQRHLEPIDQSFRAWAAGYCLKVGWLVVEGRWPASELSDLLRRLELAAASGTIDQSRTQWFSGAVARALAKKGIPFWKGKRKEPPK